jgi:transketolase
VKPIDAATIEACASECGGRLVVVEDHWPEGGLGDAVCEVFAGRPAPAITRLAVRALPGSGTPRELLGAAGIDAAAIAAAVTRAVRPGQSG